MIQLQNKEQILDLKVIINQQESEFRVFKEMILKKLE